MKDTTWILSQTIREPAIFKISVFNAACFVLEFFLVINEHVHFNAASKLKKNRKEKYTRLDKPYEGDLQTLNGK